MALGREDCLRWGRCGSPVAPHWSEEKAFSRSGCVQVGQPLGVREVTPNLSADGTEGCSGQSTLSGNGCVATRAVRQMGRGKMQREG